MAKLIDFDFCGDHAVLYAGQEVPEHTQRSLENYFIHGFQPGGFLTACLTGDLFHAVTSADTANRQMLWAIVRWIMNYAPNGSWGSAEIVQDWINDENGLRTQYREQCEKNLTWKSLAKQSA